MTIPPVPVELLDSLEGLFIPSKEWADWAHETFISGTGELINPDHANLANCYIGFVLTNEENREKGKRVLGTCQMGEPSGKPWSKAQRRQQITEWFGVVPKFLITLDAVFLSTAEPIEACALVEHELYHAGIAKDVFGSPRYDSETGAPIFAMRPHDVEEFAGIVERYGAWNEDLEDMRKAFLSEPKFGRVKLNGICGCGAAL